METWSAARVCVESDSLENTGSSLHPSSLSPVQDERNQVLTTYLWIRQVWHDAYLRWDKEDYDDLEMINIPSDLVWKPDIVLYNKSVTNAGTERLKAPKLNCRFCRRCEQSRRGVRRSFQHQREAALQRRDRVGLSSHHQEHVRGGRVLLPLRLAAVQPHLRLLDLQRKPGGL